MTNPYTEEALNKLTIPELKVLIKENKWKIRRSKLRKAQYIANIIAVTTPKEVPDKPKQKALDELAKAAALKKPKKKNKRVVRWHPLA